MRALIAGNWKMNGLASSLHEIAAVANSLAARPSTAEVLICPPFTLIGRAREASAGQVAIGAQDCHPSPCGAFTGDVSTEMIADAGASAVIVGHSERRLQHGETDAMIAAKVQAAWRAHLLPILCVGETEAQHDAGQACEIVVAQLDICLPQGASQQSIVVAYEPVWAIGSGRTPSPAEIGRMHAVIRARLEHNIGAEGALIRLLYGGSVKPGNAAEILGLPNVNGALVGGASLKAQEFLGIVRAVPEPA